MNRLLVLLVFAMGCAEVAPCKDELKNEWKYDPYNVPHEVSAISTLANGCVLRANTYYVNNIGGNYITEAGAGYVPAGASFGCALADCNDSNYMNRVSDPYDIQLNGDTITSNGMPLKRK